MEGETRTDRLHAAHARLQASSSRFIADSVNLVNLTLQIQRQRQAMHKRNVLRWGSCVVEWCVTMKSLILEMRRAESLHRLVVLSHFSGVARIISALWGRSRSVEGRARGTRVHVRD
jgi:hypothetical protein